MEEGKGLTEKQVEHFSKLCEVAPDMKKEVLLVTHSATEISKASSMNSFIINYSFIISSII